MPDLNAIATEMGELAREEAHLTHKLLKVQARRCALQRELLEEMVGMGHVDPSVAQAAAQKDPPPNPGGGG